MNAAFVGPYHDDSIAENAGDANADTDMPVDNAEAVDSDIEVPVVEGEDDINVINGAFGNMYITLFC